MSAGEFIEYGFHPCPLGRCLIGLIRGRICYLSFADSGRNQELLNDLSCRCPGPRLKANRESTARALRIAFDSKPPPGTDIKLLLFGTRFQLEVWGALMDFPAGSVCTYAELAVRVGRPQAARAVGSAVGANPVAWLVPCHRVIRSDGGIGGYRWGVARKKCCLEFDKRLLAAAE